MHAMRLRRHAHVGRFLVRIKGDQPTVKFTDIVPKDVGRYVAAAAFQNVLCTWKSAPAVRKAGAGPLKCPPGSRACIWQSWPRAISCSRRKRGRLGPSPSAPSSAPSRPPCPARAPPDALVRPAHCSIAQIQLGRREGDRDEAGVAEEAQRHVAGRPNDDQGHGRVGQADAEPRLRRHLESAHDKVPASGFRLTRSSAGRAGTGTGAAAGRAPDHVGVADQHVQRVLGLRRTGAVKVLAKRCLDARTWETRTTRRGQGQARP